MANKYWVGGAGTWDLSSTTHWSNASGGAAGATAPGNFDTAIFDAASGSGSVVRSTGVAGQVNHSAANIDLQFNAANLPNMSITHSGGTLTVSGGCSFTTLYVAGTEVRTLNLSGSITVSSQYSVGGSNITINGAPDLTVNAEKSAIVSGQGYLNSLTLGGTTANVVFNITFSGDIGILSSTRTVPFEIKLASNPLTVSNWNILGSVSAPVKITSSTPGVRQKLVKQGGGQVHVDYFTIQDSDADPGATWFAGEHSVDLGNNLDWTFATNVAPKGFFFGSTF